MHVHVNAKIKKTKIHFPLLKNYSTVKNKTVIFTVKKKKRQLWLPELYRHKYGSNVIGFTDLT